MYEVQCHVCATVILYGHKTNQRITYRDEPKLDYL